MTLPMRSLLTLLLRALFRVRVSGDAVTLIDEPELAAIIANADFAALLAAKGRRDPAARGRSAS